MSPFWSTVIGLVIVGTFALIVLFVIVGLVIECLFPDWFK